MLGVSNAHTTGSTGKGNPRCNNTTAVCCDVRSDQSAVQKRIGGIVISSDKKFCEGIISERDIVKILSRNGAVALDHTVDNYMTSKLISCTPDATADRVLTVMTEKRFRHMPVIVNSELLGLATIGDIVKARLTELEMEKEALEGMIMGY